MEAFAKLAIFKWPIFCFDWVVLWVKWHKLNHTTELVYSWNDTIILQPYKITKVRGFPSIPGIKGKRGCPGERWSRRLLWWPIPGRVATRLTFFFWISILHAVEGVKFSLLKVLNFDRKVELMRHSNDCENFDIFSKVQSSILCQKKAAAL